MSTSDLKREQRRCMCGGICDRIVESPSHAYLKCPECGRKFDGTGVDYTDFAPPEKRDSTARAARIFRDAAKLHEAGAAIKLGRKAMGWSQSKLAEKLGLSEHGQKQVSEWESGKVNPGDRMREELARIADDLDAPDGAAGDQ